MPFDGPEKPYALSPVGKVVECSLTAGYKWVLGFRVEP
jgi:hypothetical protein